MRGWTCAEFAQRFPDAAVIHHYVQVGQGAGWKVGGESGWRHPLDHDREPRCSPAPQRLP
jgi:hypothetical protein